ncbi:MAG TPA: ATP-binding protein, partial [Puia sp.]
VIVQLTRADRKVLITVEDDGTGFELHAPKKASGMGLHNVRSRVNYLQGRMDIESRPGEGTIINIELIV